jgi:hypothetical protein
MNDKYNYIEIGTSTDWKLYRIVPSLSVKDAKGDDSSIPSAASENVREPKIPKEILKHVSEQPEDRPSRINFVSRSIGKSNIVRGFTA